MVFSVCHSPHISIHSLCRSQQVSVALPAGVSPVPEPSRETESPASGAPRPAVSISEFLEDPSAKLRQHDPCPMPMPGMQLPETDSLNPPETHPLRPPNPSPFESEAEEDLENTRLVSIEEFLGHGRPTVRQQVRLLLSDNSSSITSVSQVSLLHCFWGAFFVLYCTWLSFRLLLVFMSSIGGIICL